MAVWLHGCMTVWLSGCVTMWQHDCPAISISKGRCLKAKAVCDRRIIT